MTKEQILLTVKNAINQHTDNSPLGIAYKHGFEDGANYILQNLQQTPCTASLELIEQMLIEVKSKMPVNTNPHVLGVIIQEIQALKWTMRLIKERQPMT